MSYTINRVVKLKVKRLKSFKEKAVGLIGRKDRAVIFETRFGIHTFGLKVPIDVLILDSQNKAIKLRLELPPNRIMLWNPIYKTVLEMPAGTIKRKGIKLSTKIEISI